MTSRSARASALERRFGSEGDGSLGSNGTGLKKRAPLGLTCLNYDQTFRLIVKPDLWSQKIRLRLSNTFGSRPITLGAVTVGLQSAAGNILAGKIQEVQFSGKGEVVLPAGEEIYSDEVFLDIDPADPLLEGHKLAVSFFVKGTSGPLTWHTDSLSTSYLSAPKTGDHTLDVNDAAFPFTTTSCEHKHDNEHDSGKVVLAHARR